mgnify:FL=1
MRLRADLDAALAAAQADKHAHEAALTRANEQLQAAQAAAPPADAIVMTSAEYESLNDEIQQAAKERDQIGEFRAKSAAKIGAFSFACLFGYTDSAAETLRQNLAKSEQEVSALDGLLEHVEQVLGAHAGLMQVHPDLKELLSHISKV